MGGLFFLFGFTTQGGTTILSHISGTHKHLNYSFKVYMYAHKYTLPDFFLFLTLDTELVLQWWLVSQSPPSSVMIVIFLVYE